MTVPDRDKEGNFMGQISAECICSKCGETFYRSCRRQISSRSDAESWRKWASEYYDLCNRCYARKCREEERKQGLYVDICINFGKRAGDGFPIARIFKGDTWPYKDRIKALRAEWTMDYPEYSRPFRWVIHCRPEECGEKVKQAELLGAKINRIPDEPEMERCRRLKACIQEELDILGPEPDWPDSVKTKWPEGAEWDGKFCGGEGRWCVYLDGVQMMLTDEEKAVMEETQKKKQEWLDGKARIGRIVFQAY